VIERLTSDSRRAAPGAAFFAWPGASADGRRFIAQAIERGCAAVVWESEGFAWDGAWRAPNAGVRDLKARAGHLAHDFYGRPSDSLWVCGVTGTNGKTSCANWLAHALSLHGMKTGVIGTLGSGFPGAFAATPNTNTTPDALELHRLLADLKSAGAAAVAMEVSSHGLDQGRVNGVAFDCALFTNLTHDHLDYHGTLAAYAEAKARLFDAPGLGAAVLNLDDPFGAQLAGRAAARGVRAIGYSLAGARAGEFIAVSSLEGQKAKIDSSWGSAEATIPQLGRFNVANALGVLGCLLAKGMPFEEGVRLLEVLPQVPGRMQKIGERPLVVVDYAHTPDALDKVLSSLRPVAQASGGRLTVVFGAGGERDKAKRPAMGSVAAARADRVVLTSDNPRGEDPRAIVEAIREAVSGDCVVELDRAQAIAAAIASADAADVVLIAGKGHEGFQEIGGRRLPFSDAAVAAAALGRRRNR
jgi:UDP-N-acetylmuramoyl-L-alanyl-D-glutamate--2,6-diaminopimelate ligase